MFEVFGRTGPPTLGGAPFWNLKIATHCSADQRTRKGLQMQFCEHTMQQNATAADSADGAYSAPPDPQLVLRGPRGGEGAKAMAKAGPVLTP